MAIRRSSQEWLTLIEQSETSSLSTLAFCKLNGVSTSTFYAKRQKLKETPTTPGFIRAEVVEKTASYQMPHVSASNMTLFVNGAELSIPQGTPANYLAELIGALS